MNNKERLFWLSGIVLLAFFGVYKIEHIDRLESLDRNNALVHRIQIDQIDDLVRRLQEVDKVEYNRGFKAGESHALIASLSGKNLYDYADGYHAALSQFASDDKNMLDIIEVLSNNRQKLIDSISNEK
jgi:hypothetical protein